jgi:hypothetical protein
MVRQNRGDLLPLNLLRVKECGSSAPLVGRRFVLRVVLFSVVTALGSSRSSGASATTAPIEPALCCSTNSYESGQNGALSAAL